MNNPFINTKLWNTLERVTVSASFEEIIATSSSLDTLQVAFTTTSGALDSTTASLAAVSASTTSGNLGLIDGVFSVRAYGAKGDNVTNDLPAFQSATAAAYAYGQGSGAQQAGRVVIPAGRYVLSGTWDLTLGDALGTGSTVGFGRISVQGAGRNSTTLSFTGGSSVDAIHVGSYTVLRDFGMLGSVANGIVSVVESGTSADFPGRSSERLLLERIFVRVSPASRSIDLQAPFWFKFDTVQSLGAVRIGTSSAGHNAFDGQLNNCEITNGTTLTMPALDVDCWNLTVQGGIIYTYLGSTQPGVWLRHGAMSLREVDFSYSAQTSTGSYDIIVDTSASDVSVITIEACALGTSGRVNSTGSSGNVWFKSGTRGHIRNCNWNNTPSIYISTGSQGVTVLDWNVSSSQIVYQGGGLSGTKGEFTTNGRKTLTVPLSATADVHAPNLLLRIDPWITSQYTASYTGSLLQSEVWNDVSGSTIKSSSYVYSGSLLSQSFVSVYDTNGNVLIGQTTASYFYSGSILVSASLSRTL